MFALKILGKKISKIKKVTLFSERFKKFLLNYKMENFCQEDHPGIKPDEPFYFQKLVAIEYARNNLFFNLDSSHLKEFDPQLYRQLVNYPSELIPILDMATNEGKEQLIIFHKKYWKEKIIYSKKSLLRKSCISRRDFGPPNSSEAA